MRSATQDGHEDMTSLELVLSLQGLFRRRLEPIQVTPLQAGVVMFLQRRADSKLKEVAAALRVQQPTLCAVVRDLECKGWVTKRRADGRTLALRLSRTGQVLARKVEKEVKQVQLVTG